MDDESESCGQRHRVDGRRATVVISEQFASATYKGYKEAGYVDEDKYSAFHD